MAGFQGNLSWALCAEDWDGDTKRVNPLFEDAATMKNAAHLPVDVRFSLQVPGLADRIKIVSESSVKAWRPVFNRLPSIFPFWQPHATYI